MQYAAMSSSSFYPNAQPYYGLVENTIQALRLVHAVRLGVVPRIIRRLNDAERKEKIISGAVFVFCVEESGIRRWTDGRVWSPCFDTKVYREMNEKIRGLKKVDGFEQWIPGDNDRSSLSSARRQQGRLYRSPVTGSIMANGGFKVAGLVKKVVKINGFDHHLISYYTQEDVHMQHFKPMSTRSDIMDLDLPPHIFRFSDFRLPPRVVKGLDGLC